MRINIAGAPVDVCSFDRAIDLTVEQALTGTTPGYIVTPNAQHVNNLQHDPLFRQIYDRAFLSVPDGVPLLWAAKFLNTPLQGRVNGSDLFERLCAIGATKPLRIFLLGGRPGAAERAAIVLENRYPGLKIVGTHCPPYGFENDPAAVAEIEAKIFTADPNLLFVGLGSPKQEKWIYANYQHLKVPVSIAIGVSFELVAGMVARAPEWMQKSGLEWLFRLFVEPKRLWKRYILGNPNFVWLVLKQKFGLGRRQIN
jgi:N-acetylglucosaminyldiphosphoundecaprenol N-acetyl-beta-D-mannosaminyltransferase